jgi:mRNA deadenylase 3'-5' endonuclease subunit Ccr4
MEKTLSKFSKEYIHYLKMKPELYFKSLSKNLKKKNQLSIMTWNTLASSYTSPSVYYYVKPDYLDEEHRMNMITYDLIRSNCDILCLQEIEKRNYEAFFQKQLEGYESKMLFKQVYMRRGLDSHVMGSLYFIEIINSGKQTIS